LEELYVKHDKIASEMSDIVIPEDMSGSENALELQKEA